ncbi:MAG: SBBP repeat-containing protein [Flavobacteriales bacterium]|nr:SBBP repeat-containing protein [Flavobacteriales bacterium]
MALSVSAQIPTLEWVIKNETNNDDMGLSIAIDDHSVYTTGFFKGQVNFDPETQEGGCCPPAPEWSLGDETTGDNNVFVQKLDTTGVLEWPVMFGGSKDDEGRGIAVDTLGNVYVTGFFQDSARFSSAMFNGPAIVSGFGKKDVFVIKISSDGDLLWAVSIGGVGDDIAQAIALDSVGNVFITGLFSETVDFDPGSEVAEQTSNGESDIFILKLDSSGQYQWAVTMGGTGADGGASVDVDAEGNVYTAGYFSNTVDLNPGSDTLDVASQGGTDIFVQKLNAQGVLIWAGSMGGSDNDEGKNIRVSNEDHLFVNGSFMQTADLDPSQSSNSHTSNGGRDIFVCRLDTAGTLDWAASMGGTDHDAPTGMDIDPDGNVLSIGYFQEEVDFDPGVGVDSYSSIGFKDMFWQKLNADGELLWVGQVGGYTDQLAKAVAISPLGLAVTTGGYQAPDGWVSSPDFDPSPTDEFFVSSFSVDLFVQCLDMQGGFKWVTYSKGNCCGGFNQYIDTDPDGNLIVAGHFAVRMDADPGPAELFFNSNAKETRTDIFVQKLDDNGELLWARHLKGVNGANIVDQVKVDATGNIYVAGRFQDTLDFDPGVGVYELFAEHGPGTLDKDIFILKLNPNGEFIWAKQFAGDGTANNSSSILDTDDDQNVYLLCTFGGTVDFDPGPNDYLVENISPNTDTDALLKLNAAGDFEWLSLMKDTTNSSGYFETEEMGGSSDGILRLFGRFDGSVDLDVGPGEFFLSLPRGKFFSTLNSSGQPVSVKTLPFGFPTYRSIWDDAGNLYLLGRVLWDDTLDLDPGPEVYEVIEDGLGSVDKFLLKLSANGEFVWARHFPTGNEGYLFLLFPLLDDNGNLLLMGGLVNEMDVDPGIGETFLQATSGTGSDNSDPCFISLDTSGTFQWALSYGNMFMTSAVVEATTYGEYVFASGGWRNGRIDFDTSADTVFLNTYNFGRYVAKWKRDDLVTIDQESILPKNELRLFPNPTKDRVTIQWPEGVGASGLELYAANGHLLEKIWVNQNSTYYQLNINYPPGFYTIRLRTSQGIYNAKLIIQ